MTTDFTTTLVAPKILHISFADRTDLAMTFVRYQEYYESDNKDFYRKCFKLEDYKKWYSEERGDGEWTYCTDWSGFNIPGWVLRDIWLSEVYHEDKTKHDEIMQMIVTRNFDMFNTGFDFYLIGTTHGATKTLRHEIAHGLYSTNPNYKKNAQKLIAALPSSIKTPFYEWLGKIGYASDVFEDELQAYFSAPGQAKGIQMLLESNLATESIFVPFMKNFDNHYQEK